MSKMLLNAFVMLLLTTTFCFTFMSCDLIRGVFGPIKSEEDYYSGDGLDDGNKAPIVSSFSAEYTPNFLYAGKLRKQVQMNKGYSTIKYQPANEARPKKVLKRKQIRPLNQKKEIHLLL